MDEARIISVREKAERAVAGMPEGGLKVKAFEVILAKLLDDEDGPGRTVVSRNVPIAASAPAKDLAKAEDKKTPDSCPARILSLREEGFFKTARTLGEIRNELQMRGWTYPVTSLSGPVQKLVQQRELRRMTGQDGKKGSYSYVAP